MLSKIILQYSATAVAALAFYGGIGRCLKATELPSVSETMQTFVDSNAISGAVTLVAHRGEVVHLGVVGQANAASERAMKPDTIFAIASMTKPITATALMMLVDEGKVNIEDPITKYVPEFKEAKLSNGDPVSGITLRHLLTHTSGLVGSQRINTSLEATAKLLANRPFGFTPGTKWQYSPGINVCGRVIEVASGMPYEQFLAERIFTPLQMTDTTFHPTDAQFNRVATLYRKGDQGALVPSNRPFARGTAGTPASPSGGLFSTASDKGRFYQMVLNGGEFEGKRLVSQKAVEAMTSIQSGDVHTGFTPGNAWGLGWCIVREPQDITGMLSPGTFGHGGAFGTQGWVDPKTQTIFVLMIQRQDLPNSDGSNIRKEFQAAAVESLQMESAASN